MSDSNIFNRFTKTLGYYCATNQFIELALRAFSNDHKQELTNRDSIINLAESYRIALTTFDATSMLKTIALSYIVNIYITFETFLKELYDDGKNMDQ